MTPNQMKRIQERKEQNGDERDVRIWDCGSPLYDSYEVVTFGHILERHLMVLPYLSGSRTPPTESSSSSLMSSTSSEKSKRAPKKGGKSSVIRFLSGFVKRKNDGEREEKAKKQKTGISKIFSWKN